MFIMEPLILNGSSLSKLVEHYLADKVASIKQTSTFSPVLATILVGNDPSSVTYVRMKGNACSRVGIESRRIALSESTTTEELLGVIDKLNSDPTVCGILLQHPVPSHIDEQLCFNSIAIEKDVDGVNTASFGAVAMGQDGFKSATPYAILSILKHYKIDIQGKEVVVIGRSAILGKPVAMLLLNENATVTICHSKTVDLPSVVGRADIVVAGVGIPKFVQKDWLKDGVVLVDAGYNAGNVGDIDLDQCKDVCSAYTPVPGGVGPMTIAMLLTQTVDSFVKMASKAVSIN